MLSWILPVAGLVITLVLGVLTVRAVRRTAQSRITLFEYDALSPYTDLVGVFDDLHITFKDEPISRDVSVFRACLVNTARFDIDQSRITVPLTIHLPSPYRWREAVVTSVTPGVKAMCLVRNDEMLELRWDLLKIDEAIEFYALAGRQLTTEQQLDEETSTGKPFDYIQFKHRITDLGRVQKERAPQTGKMSLFSKLLPVSAMLLLTGVFWFFPFARRPQIEYYMHGNDGQAIQATLRATNRSSIAISGDGYKEVFDLDSFSKRWQIGEPVIVPDTRSFILEWMMASVMTAFVLSMGGTMIIEERKRKRVSELLVTREEERTSKKT